MQPRALFCVHALALTAMALAVQAQSQADTQQSADPSGASAAVAKHAASQSLHKACAFLSRLAGAEIEL